MKFGLFVKPHVSNKKLVMTKSDANQKVVLKKFATFTEKHFYTPEHLF